MMNQQQPRLTSQAFQGTPQVLRDQNMHTVLSSAYSNDSEWAILQHDDNVTDVLSSSIIEDETEEEMSSECDSLSEEDMLDAIVINQSTRRVEQWLLMNKLKTDKSTVSNVPIDNDKGVKLAKRLQTALNRKSNVMKGCNYEYRHGNYLNRPTLLNILDAEKEGILMCNPELDNVLPMSWRRVLNPIEVRLCDVAATKTRSYWDSEDGSGLSWVL